MKKGLVSILIQPEGWMLWRGGLCRREPANMFQSSSSPKAGCYRCSVKFIGYVPGFNPHPARRLDAMIVAHYKDGILGVSILIQPEGWML